MSQLAERVALMKPQIARLRAGVAGFQVVNSIGALRDLLAGTNLEGANLTPHLPILARHQLKNDLVEAPAYKG